MADSSIAKDRLPEFLAALSKDCAVHGPTVEGDVIVFRPLSSAEEFALDYRNTTLSPKELFLPRTEVIYEFDGQDFIEEFPRDEKRVIFGIRPCDCRALTMLDRVFDSDRIKDPFYTARRANTVLIALACNRPLSTCFCTALGGDPFGEEGADVILGDAGDSLAAKALTPKGEEFLKSYNKFFSKKASFNWQEQAKKARAKIASDLPLEESQLRLKERFEDDLWDAVSRKCLGCGTCSYYCPTCYCFDLTDEKTATGGRKIRRWDCCMSASFTLHASGHNPRPVNAPRLRQKIMHKFSYFAEEHGVDSCVGCGRCVRNCPVNLDIRQLLAEALATPASATEE